MQEMNSADFTSMLDADDCELVIRTIDGNLLYQAKFDMADLMAHLNGNGIVTSFFYHRAVFDDEGNMIGREDKPTIRFLRITSGEEMMPPEERHLYEFGVIG